MVGHFERSGQSIPAGIIQKSNGRACPPLEPFPSRLSCPRGNLAAASLEQLVVERRSGLVDVVVKKIGPFPKPS